MPTYDYTCKKCSVTWTIFSKEMTTPKKDPFKKCLDCGGRLKRLIGSGGGIIFRGSGFYATDYRKDSK